MDMFTYIRMLNNDFGASNKKESDVYSIKSDLAYYFEDSLNYEPNTLVNGVKQGLLVNKTRDKQKLKVTAHPDESLKCGDIIDCYNEKWLVTSIDFDRRISCSGEIERCNYELRFIGKDGKPISRYCIIRDSTGGIDQDKYMLLGTGKRVVVLPFDEETVLIKREKRFLIDHQTSTPKAYMVVYDDRVEKNYGDNGGVITLVVEECELSKDDNIELMIADYYKYYKSTSPSHETNYCEITYTGDPVLRVGAGFKKFTAVFKDSDGNIVEETPVWKIIVPDDVLAQYLITETSDNYIRLKASNINMIGSTVLLELKNSDGTISTSLVLEVKSLG